MSASARYLLTIVAVGAALVVRWLLDPLLGDHLPFVTFFVAVGFAAWLGGLRPAALATALGFVLALYFFVPPRGSLVVTPGPPLVGLTMYFMVSLAVAGFGEAMHAAERRARRSEEGSRERAEELRVTLASIGDAVLTTDTHARVTSLNAAAEALTGWKAADARGLPLETVFRILDEATREPVANPATRALREGAVVGLANHTILVARDGVERPIDDSAAPIRREDGTVVGCVLVFRDVSARRAAEKELRASEARKTAILATALDCIVSIDHEGKIVDFNPAAERTFGYSRAEALGREMGALLVPPRLRERHRQGLARYLATGEARILDRRIELTALRADGSEIEVELAITRIDGDGPPRFTGYLRDIGARKAAEARLRASEERYRTLIEQVTDYAIFRLDAEGRPTTWNEGVKHVLGFDEAEFVGRDVLPRLFTPEDVERGIPQRELAQAAAEGSASDDRWMQTKDGRRFYAMGITHALRDESGGLLGFTKVMRDQTERKEIEDRLRQLAADLSEADRRKNEFLAMLAHELRNPLAPLRNGLELLRLTNGDPRTAPQALDMMQRQVGHMVRLIDDLLDVSRITRGKIELAKERIELAALVDHVLEAARPACARTGVELAVTRAPQPLVVDGDPTRLAQVLGNLLDNACKFTAAGGRVALSTERNGREVLVRVKDTGIGIPADQVARIFEMFTQVDTSLQRRHGGLGIGLTLVKSLVELHGGRVEVHSDGPGRGSEFVVSLPLADGPPGPAEPAGAR